MVNPQHDPLKVAVSEAQTALDTALKLVNDATDTAQKAADSSATVVRSTAGGAEKSADQVLNDVADQVESALRQLTTLAHVTKPK